MSVPWRPSASKSPKVLIKNAVPALIPDLPMQDVWGGRVEYSFYIYMLGDSGAWQIDLE